MGNYKQEAGKKGEDIAAAYLEELGFSVVERNFYAAHGELDIIARDGDTTVFCEVKLRRGSAFGNIAESITPAKKRALMRTAEVYAQKHGLLNSPMRFDVILISDNFNIEYIKNAEISY